MGFSRKSARRRLSHTDLILFEAIAAGIIMGLKSFILKIVTIFTPYDLMSPSFLFNPLLWLAAILGIMGFLLFQQSLFKKNMSLVTPVTAALSIIFPILLAVVYLEESLSSQKVIGLGLILIGVVGLENRTRQPRRLLHFFRY